MSSKNPLYRYIFHGTRLNIAPEAQRPLQAVGLNNASLWGSFKEGVVLSQGTTTCLRVPLPNSDKCIYFKRYHYTKNLWEFFLRRSKAANELVNYQRFKAIGIPTLDTLALYEERFLGRLNIACIVTKELKNTTRVDHFYTDVLLKMPLMNTKLLSIKLKKSFSNK